MATFSVIIAGAGSSQRFGGSKNKIFHRIGGKPVFLHSIEAFASRPDVLEVVLVCSEADRDQIQSTWGTELENLSVTLVNGGKTRTGSVRNGLAAVSPNAEYIAIHDAARPCISRELIDSIFAMAEKTGAAIPAIAVSGTVKRVSESGEVTDTLPRQNYRDIHEVQTPQVFKTDLLKEAYLQEAESTDDAAMVEAAGHKVSIVPGDRRNVKITTPDDLAFAESVIDSILQ